MAIRALALTVLVLTLAACGAGAADPGGGDASGPGSGLSVATPLFPVSWMAEQLAPGAEVHFLLAGGGDPHDLELSPSERELLETADVVAYAGDLDFMPQFESAVPSAGGEVVSLAQVAGDDRLLRFDHDDRDDDHDDDHAGSRSGGSDRGGGEIDPHLWFDPAVMDDTAAALGDALATADPDRADAYGDAAAELAAELDDLSGEVDARLSACAHDTVIISHEAYAYLLEPRGISQEGISSAGGHGEASPRRLAELSERIVAEGIPAVAAEPLHGRADAEALAAEAGVDIVEVNPLEDVSDDEYERGYPRLLLDQVDSFARVLGCEGRR